ncbi:MAG: hypothetical protein D6725_16945 [Planctomycetota bacterium]|nr:MAG: hypothetical protein D6725_16945 [Planctomycetota bacterium]
MTVIMHPLPGAARGSRPQSYGLLPVLGRPALGCDALEQRAGVFAQNRTADRQSPNVAAPGRVGGNFRGPFASAVTASGQF